jgi:hypothetical protein
MFKSQQYRAKATECGELVKSSSSADESRKFRDLEDRFVLLADNERGLADAHNNAVHIAEEDRSRGAALAAEEEHVLRCALKRPLPPAATRQPAATVSPGSALSATSGRQSGHR